MSKDVDESTESIDLSNDATIPQDVTRLTALLKEGQKKFEKQTEAFQKKLIQLTGENDELLEKHNTEMEAINMNLVNGSWT